MTLFIFLQDLLVDVGKRFKIHENEKDLVTYKESIAPEFYMATCAVQLAALQKRVDKRIFLHNMVRVAQMIDNIRTQNMEVEDMAKTGTGASVFELFEQFKQFVQPECEQLVDAQMKKRASKCKERSDVHREKKIVNTKIKLERESTFENYMIETNSQKAVTKYTSSSVRVDLASFYDNHSSGCEDYESLLDIDCNSKLSSDEAIFDSDCGSEKPQRTLQVSLFKFIVKSLF